jgi:hypothetical protein
MSVSVDDAASIEETVESMQLALPSNGFHREPRCRVCRNDLVRTKVNHLLATGASYTMVLRALGEDNAALDKCDQVTIDSIRNHTTRHFPVQNAARATDREILERRAREAQIDFVEGIATAITPMALLETVMVKGYETLVDPDSQVDVKTGMIAACRLQELIDARAGQPDVAGMLAEVGRVIEVVRTFIPSEKWPEVQAALRGETPIRQQQAKPVEGIRMVDIDDMPDEDGN